jgi:hypothetical protein
LTSSLHWRPFGSSRGTSFISPRVRFVSDFITVCNLLVSYFILFLVTFISFTQSQTMARASRLPCRVATSRGRSSSCRPHSDTASTLKSHSLMEHSLYEVGNWKLFSRYSLMCFLSHLQSLHIPWGFFFTADTNYTRSGCRGTASRCERSFPSLILS